MSGVVPSLPLYSFKSWTWKPSHVVPSQISKYSSRKQASPLRVHIPVGPALVTHTVVHITLLVGPALVTHTVVHITLLV